MVPLDATVVIKIPTVARISGDGSPTADRHSCFTKFMTSGKNLWKYVFTLFFNISPLRDLVGSS